MTCSRGFDALSCLWAWAARVTRSCWPLWSYRLSMTANSSPWLRSRSRRVVKSLICSTLWVSGNYWGQVAVNHLRERVNMTHVVLSIPAIVLAVILVGIPLNRILGGTRSSFQRLAIAIVSIPATLILAVTLFTFNALVPETYATLLRFADLIWQASLNALSAWGDSIPGARKLTNVARQGFSGHHFVIMALCSAIAAFLVNALFASTARSRESQ